MASTVMKYLAGESPSHYRSAVIEVLTPKFHAGFKESNIIVEYINKDIKANHYEQVFVFLGTSTITSTKFANAATMTIYIPSENTPNPRIVMSDSTDRKLNTDDGEFKNVTEMKALLKSYFIDLTPGVGACATTLLRICDLLIA